MSKRDLVECLLLAGIRLLAVILILLGVLSLVMQLLESWYRFDPNYLGTFLMDTLFRPVLFLFSGAVLYGLSAGLARFMSKPVADETP